MKTSISQKGLRLLTIVWSGRGQTQQPPHDFTVEFAIDNQLIDCNIRYDSRSTTAKLVWILEIAARLSNSLVWKWSTTFKCSHCNKKALVPFSVSLRGSHYKKGQKKKRKKMTLSSLFRFLFVVCFIFAFFALQLDLVSAGQFAIMRRRSTK